MREIEIKVQIEKPKPLLDFLRKHAKQVETEQQVDHYYSPKKNSFLLKDPVVEWLRIREEDGRDTITYKHWHYESDGKSNYADEHETKVEDSTALREILESLGFEKIITVDKTRVSFLYEHYLVSFDTVVDLGSFVEIEYKGEAPEDPKKITADMLAFLESLNVGKVERNNKGYPKLLLEKIA